MPIRGDFGVVLWELCPHFKFFIGETPKKHFFLARTMSFELLTAKVGSGVCAVGEAEKKKGREGKEK